MTYSESARGVKITHLRAMQELDKHGMTSEEDRTDFYAALGTKLHYRASDVLAWLGY